MVEEENFNFRFIQTPGEKNALGKVRISFDSQFDIYLHDTPYKKLFEKERRDLSSGCIRLEDAKLLVKTIPLKDGYHESKIDDLYHNKETVRVNVKSSFMVFILYLTALVKIATSGGVRLLAAAPTRSLYFYNINTGEYFREVYWEDGSYVLQALNKINYILRDFRTGEVRPIDLRLLDLLYVIKSLLGTEKPFLMFLFMS